VRSGGAANGAGALVECGQDEKGLGAAD